jgi:hypothetical protein
VDPAQETLARSASRAVAGPVSAPDWRDVLARVLFDASQTLLASPMVRRLTWDERGSPTHSHYQQLADAIIEAIAARGYRLHRDHDWKTTPDITYAQVVMTCQRRGCLAVSPGLRDTATCEGEP